MTKRSNPSTIAADAPQTGKITAIAQVVTRNRRASFTSTGRRGMPAEPGRRRLVNIASALMTDHIASTHNAVIMNRLNNPGCVPICVLTSVSSPYDTDPYPYAPIEASARPLNWST